MNSLQIDSILSKNRFTKRYYKGVYGSDNIKNFHSYPYAIVVNTQKINQPGEHWIGMYVKKVIGDLVTHQIKILKSSQKILKISNKTK